MNFLSQFPPLQNLPCLSLGSYPTPLERLENLEKKLDHYWLFIKRDDLTSEIYGGNKVRKFEFLFGELKKQEIDTILTAGGLGSHHNLATAFFCQKLGWDSFLFFFHQPFTEHCKEVLYFCWKSGAHLEYTKTPLKTASRILLTFNQLKKEGRKKPYILSPGASTLLGSLGYVKALFELQNQLREKKLPDFDAIFLAMGSCGTFAGLLAGAQILKLKTEIWGVRVVPSSVSNRFVVYYHVSQLLKFLEKKTGKAFPKLKLSEIKIAQNYFGKGYGYSTEKALAALKIARETCRLELEQTYTAKAFAAFLDYAQTHKNQKVLYWHTHSFPLPPSPPLSTFLTELPSSFHKELGQYALAEPS